MMFIWHEESESHYIQDINSYWLKYWSILPLVTWWMDVSHRSWEFCLESL